MKANNEDKNTVASVTPLPDRAVSCPICRQEFWGYSEIIFCSCGWTYIKEDESRRNRINSTQREFSGDRGTIRLVKDKNSFPIES